MSRASSVHPKAAGQLSLYGGTGSPASASSAASEPQHPGPPSPRRSPSASLWACLRLWEAERAGVCLCLSGVCVIWGIPDDELRLVEERRPPAPPIIVSIVEVNNDTSGQNLQNKTRIKRTIFTDYKLQSQVYKVIRHQWCIKYLKIINE